MSEISVIDQMLAHGLPRPDTLDLSGKLTYYRVGGKKQKKAWYSLREMSVLSRQGGQRRIIVGSFGAWNLNTPREGIKVKVNWKQMNEEERRQLRERSEAAASIRKEEEARAHALVASRASELIAKGKPFATNDYLRRKQVESEANIYGLPAATLFIPCEKFNDGTRVVVGGQTIAADGTKLHLKNTPTSGGFFVFGDLVHGETILLCEGVATALSLRLACQHQQGVGGAWDCGNLVNVATQFRQHFPRSPILICADDDWMTKKSSSHAENPGRSAAKLAVRRVANCHMVMPVFPAGVVREKKHTDFNDLAVLCGIEAVAKQLRPIIKYLSTCKAA